MRACQELDSTAELTQNSWWAAGSPKAPRLSLEQRPDQIPRKLRGSAHKCGPECETNREPPTRRTLPRATAGCVRIWRASEHYDTPRCVCAAQNCMPVEAPKTLRAAWGVRPAAYRAPPTGRREPLTDYGAALIGGGQLVRMNPARPQLGVFFLPKAGARNASLAWRSVG